jgi:hypothetical protein
MQRREKVELFEQIRREYEFGVGTIKGVARKLGVHRRMVRQALADAQPPERRRSERERPVVGPLIPFIDTILHPVGRMITCGFGQLPAVLALYRREQTPHIGQCPPARLDPPKARPDPVHHFRKLLCPALHIRLGHPSHLFMPRLTPNSGCSTKLLRSTGTTRRQPLPRVIIC